MSESAPTAPEVGLSDVLLAMDVVDTLRHEQRVVSEALSEDAREAALIERVRRAYKAQGLEVSDELIAAGVAKLKEQQFEYTPPGSGFATSMARAWVNRGRIGTGVGAVGVLAAVLGGGWYGFVELPAARERAAMVEFTDRSVAQMSDDLALFDSRLSGLREQAANARTESTPTMAATAVSQEINRTEAALGRAENHLRTAASLSQSPINPDPGSDSIAKSRADRLQQQMAAIGSADTELGLADEALAGLGDLRILPETIAALRSEGVSLARTANARSTVEGFADDAAAALATGNAQGAVAQVNDLRSTIDTLQNALTVRVVSRPGILSGVIREPKDNPGVDNYYLVVEAVDADGRPARLPIRSEEDGSTRTVALWGVRVSAQQFDRIRRDKQDDGIIQRNELGTKPRGQLEFEWAMDEPSGYIHSWEAPR